MDAQQRRGESPRLLLCVDAGGREKAGSRVERGKGHTGHAGSTVERSGEESKGTQGAEGRERGGRERGRRAASRKAARGSGRCGYSSGRDTEVGWRIFGFGGSVCIGALETTNALELGKQYCIAESEKHWSDWHQLQIVFVETI